MVPLRLSSVLMAALLSAALFLSGCAGRKDSAYQKQIKSLQANRYDSLPESSLADAVPTEISSEQHEKLGDAMLGKGKLDTALVQYEKALGLDPGNPKILCKKGFTLLAGKRHDGAIEQFQAALAEKKDFPPACEGLGRAHMGKNQLENGIKYFKKTLALDPSRWKAHNYLGNIYDRQGKHELAASAYESALTVKPDAGFVYNNLGVSLSLAGDHGKAVQAFRRAIEARFANSRVHNNLGLALSSIGRYDRALEAFKKGGSEAAAYNNLGCVYLKHGKPAEAARYFEKAIAIVPRFYVQAAENLEKARTSGEASGMIR